MDEAMWIDYWQRGRDKNRFQYCLNPDGFIHYMRAIQGHSGGNKADPSLLDNVAMPYNCSEYIDHVGSSLYLHYIFQSGLISGGKDTKEGRQTVFFTAVHPMTDSQENEHYDVMKPRQVPFKTTCKVYQHAVLLGQFQTRSNAILHDSTKEKFDTPSIPYIVIVKGNTPWCPPWESWSTTRVSPSEGLFKKSFKEQLWINPLAVNRARRTKNRSKPSWRHLQTSWQDRKWGPFLHRYVVRAASVQKQLEACLECTRSSPAPWKKNRIPLTLCERSVTPVKMPTQQFLPANKFASVQYGETRGDGIRVLHRHLLRQIGKGHPHGGLFQNGKNVSDCPCARRSVNSTPHLALVTHANTFSRVAQAELTLRSLHCFA